MSEIVALKCCSGNPNKGINVKNPDILRERRSLCFGVAARLVFLVVYTLFRILGAGL